VNNQTLQGSIVRLVNEFIFHDKYVQSQASQLDFLNRKRSL